MWLPKYVASDITSLNQKDIDDIKAKNAKYKKYCALLKTCIDKTPDVVRVNNDIQVNIGHGEGETK